MKKALLFVADGFEEIEALGVVDVLRRGEIDIQLVSITGNKQVKSVHDIEVTVDKLFDEVKNDDIDCVIFPGGLPISESMDEWNEAVKIAQKLYDSGKLVAGICNAPALILSKMSIPQKHEAVCFPYPGFEDKLAEVFTVSHKNVVVDKNIITAKAAGYSFNFAFEILAYLNSREVSDEIVELMYVNTQQEA